ncbi:MAG: hypothetical protein KF819_31180 [Labilithrix sp.]|nr:hypothetical protein [Labilithrix sp.]
MREDAFEEGTLTARMLRIAIPLTLSAAVRYGVDLSNAYWVGKLGVVALSIVTALGTFMSLSKMFAGLTSAGTSAVVGRMVGESRRREALRVAYKASAVAPLLGAAAGLLALGVSGVALDALGFQGAARSEARMYLGVLLAGLPFSFGLMALSGALVGLGRPKASVKASVASLIVGFTLTPLLLRGFGAGVWGAGVAQALGDACGYVVGLRALSEGATEPAMPWRKRVAKLRELWPVIRIGLPLTIDAVIHASVWFALIAFLSRYGAAYVAAQGAEERLTQILNLPTEGIAPATATLVGFMLGKGRRSEALKVVWLALSLVGVVAIGGIALLRLVPGPVVGWLCNDPSFVHVGVEVLTIAAVGLAFLGGRDVMEASFGGIGNAIPPVIVGVGVAALRFPLAYVVAVKLGKGGLGVAWAVNVSLVIQTLVLVTVFLSRFGQTEGQKLEIIAPSIAPPARGAAK